MAVAVALRLDDGSAASVVRLWERLYIQGLDSTLMHPGSEPRIPLASFPDDVDAGRITSLIDRLSGSWRAMQVTAIGMTIFGGRSPTLALTVAPTTALLTLHEQVHTILADQPHDACWRPGCWTPGIVVSEWAVSVADAVRCVLPMMMKPFAGRLVALEVLDRLCGEVIASWDLPG
jgi:hypothetical protein